MNLPVYQCFKQVQAAPIVLVSVERSSIVVDSGTELIVVSDPTLFLKAPPEAGDYLVIYTDGYQSTSPKAAFEGGYSRVF